MDEETEAQKVYVILPGDSSSSWYNQSWIPQLTDAWTTN